MKSGWREPGPVMGMSLSLALLTNSMALASNPHGPVVAAGDASHTLLEFSRESNILSAGRGIEHLNGRKSCNATFRPSTTRQHPPAPPCPLCPKNQ